jgi:DNA-binding NarL/FixJ family response regulator
VPSSRQRSRPSCRQPEAPRRRRATRPSAFASTARWISARARHAAGTGADVDALTERERDIAGLVSQGQSNKQVAAALFLSETTIEHNLSRIYAKLGVRSRHELTRLLAG